MPKVAARIGHRFKKGDPRPAGAGRRPGQLNRFTTVLKVAILNAGERAGFPKIKGKKIQPGPGGLESYLVWLALYEPKSYATLLGRVLPMQITGDGGGPVRVIDEAMSPAAAASAYAAALKSQGPPTMIDVTPLSNVEPGMGEERQAVKGSLPRVIPGRVR